MIILTQSPSPRGIEMRGTALITTLQKLSFLCTLGMRSRLEFGGPFFLFLHFYITDPVSQSF